MRSNTSVTKFDVGPHPSFEAFYNPRNQMPVDLIKNNQFKNVSIAEAPYPDKPDTLKKNLKGKQKSLSRPGSRHKAAKASITSDAALTNMHQTASIDMATLDHEEQSELSSFLHD